MKCNQQITAKCGT